MRKVFIVLISAFVLALVAAACTSGNDETPVPTATDNGVEPSDAPDDSTPTSTPDPTGTQAPDGPATTFTDGQHVVGTDIDSGTYRSSASTASSDPSDSCFWQRLSGFGGQPSDSIASRLVNDPTVVTIVDSDAGFFSQNCGTWSPADSIVTTGPTDPFGGGTFIVGTDIAPGTWSHVASDQCFWQRLSGFSGDLEEIITEQSDDPLTVEIASTDAGFFSADCGTWSFVE